MLRVRQRRRLFLRLRFLLDLLEPKGLRERAPQVARLEPEGPGGFALEPTGYLEAKCAKKRADVAPNSADECEGLHECILLHEHPHPLLSQGRLENEVGHPLSHSWSADRAGTLNLK